MGALPEGVTPIRPNIRIRADENEQASVRLHRRLLDRMNPKLVKAALVGEDPELAAVHVAMHVTATKQLPAFHLRLIVRDDRPPAIRLADAARRVDLRRAEMQLAEARASIVWMEGGSQSEREAHRKECDAAREAWKEAVAVYLSVPSAKRFQIANKRARVGRNWLAGHPEWRALLDEDEARFPRLAKQKEAANG